MLEIGKLQPTLIVNAVGPVGSTCHVGKERETFLQTL